MVGLDIAAAAPNRATLDWQSFLFSASAPMLVLEWTLLAAAAFVWVAIVVKSRQIGRWRRAEQRFERDVSETDDWDAMRRRCEASGASIGAPILAALFRAAAYPDVLEAVADRELERQSIRVHGLTTALSSIAVVAPLAGLFGTVYGIIHAFLQIGAAKTASLDAVAPAIGEALITTGIGLFAAIPAVVAYNVLSQRLDDLLAGVETAARVWAGRVRASLRYAED